MPRNKSLTQFFRDVRGNVAPMFALAVIPIIGSIGAAIDYSSANSVKSAMQAALDATALQLSQSAPAMTNKQLQSGGAQQLQCTSSPGQRVSRQALGNLHECRRSWLVGVSSGSGLSAAGSTLTVSGSVTVSRTTSCASWAFGNHRLELEHSQLGQRTPAGRARARQHRIDGERRQDRRAQDGDQGIACAVKSRRVRSGRRLCLDHPIQQRRQCRGRQFDASGSTGPLGMRRMART